MRIIEPCCATKQFMFLRDLIGNNGKTEFQGFGDLSLTELLPALLTRYSETEMMIVAPTLPDQAADIISQWLNRQWARMDGKGKLDCLKHLTVVADLSEDASPKASEWLKDNPFGSRLTLVDKAQDDTALLLPDIAVTGPLNFKYNAPFVCEVTTIADEVSALWKQYTKLTRRTRRQSKKAADNTEAAKPDVETETPTAEAIDTPTVDTAETEREESV